MRNTKLYHLTLLPLALIGLFLIFGYNKLSQDSPKPVTLVEFNKLVNADKNVLVYFHVSWCAVCRKMKPIIDTIDISNKTIKVIKIDTDVDKEIANQFEIKDLPVLILFRNGRINWTYVGLIDKNILKQKLPF